MLLEELLELEPEYPLLEEPEELLALPEEADELLVLLEAPDELLLLPDHPPVLLEELELLLDDLLEKECELELKDLEPEDLEPPEKPFASTIPACANRNTANNKNINTFCLTFYPPILLLI